MKERKLKKIAKLISYQLHAIEAPIREVEYRAEYDSEVSDKLKKFILNVIQYKENISITVSEKHFTISTNDIKNIKKSNSNNHSNSINKYSGSDENYLEIFVDDKGFYLNYGYRKRSRYTDEEIFNELLPLVKKRNKEINSENFNEIWEEVMIESGIMRDNNLDELGI
jgi:hypothetical protein